MDKRLFQFFLRRELLFTGIMLTSGKLLIRNLKDIWSLRRLTEEMAIGSSITQELSNILIKLGINLVKL